MQGEKSGPAPFQSLKGILVNSTSGRMDLETISLRINELVAELLEFVKRLGSHLLHSSIDEMVFYCVIQTNQ